MATPNAVLSITPYKPLAQYPHFWGEGGNSRSLNHLYLCNILLLQSCILMISQFFAKPPNFCVIWQIISNFHTFSLNLSIFLNTFVPMVSKTIFRWGTRRVPHLYNQCFPFVRPSVRSSVCYRNLLQKILACFCYRKYFLALLQKLLPSSVTENTYFDLLQKPIQSPQKIL